MITTSLTGAQALEDSVTRDYRLQLIERQDVALLSRRILRMRIPDRRSLGTVLATLGLDRRIEDSQPNYLYRHQAGPPGIGQANPQYALGKIEIRSAHSLAQGRGAIVAIMDSAIDLTHPDLSGGVAQSYDAVGDADTNPDPHGTAIAGIIRAQGAVMLGVAPLAKLLCVRVFTPRLARDPAASTNALLRGLDWSIKQGARVINLSFVGPRDPLVYKALKAAFNDKQAIIVAPAGNGGENAPPAYPGAYQGVIAVTATDQSDRLYKQANRGSYIAIAAPGVDVLAPTLGRAHEQKTGTSFAAAHVSGIVALMLERNPQLTPGAVRRALMAAAQPLGGRRGGNEFGAGRANAFKTLKIIGQARRSSEYGDRLRPCYELECGAVRLN
jgi:subtilisin family serine protease